MKTKSIILLTIIYLFGSCANENPGDKATRVNKPASFQAAVLNEKTTNQPIVALQKKISKLKSTEYAKTNTVVPQTETRTLKAGTVDSYQRIQRHNTHPEGGNNPENTGRNICDQG